MGDTTYNIGLYRPANGEGLGDWDALIHGNWGTIDATLAAIGATSGGTGHVHNGTRGQGPKLRHSDLDEAGTKTHSQIDTDINTIQNQLTYITNNYCADPLCGGQKGGDDPQPPVHYTDNFTVNLPTPLAQMDWLVSSTSGNTDFIATGSSAFLRVTPSYLGNPLTEAYAAVVKCQIPHSTAQRVTFHVTRFTADDLHDGDSVMMVMALMSTHLLGTATPFIHLCGIKMVIILTKVGGSYNVTRIALAEKSDNDFAILKQDSNTGLTDTDAEAFFRGCHEFSTSEDGGVWYYHNRAPIWILPKGTATPYFMPIQATLLSVNEPPFGSIGFGVSWNLRYTSVFDLDLAWFTIDSKDNVEDTYITLYPDPGNIPAPMDPKPEELCCGGAGPVVGERYAFDNGLEDQILGCVADPFDGILVAPDIKVPCNGLMMSAPPTGFPTPPNVSEGDSFEWFLPVTNMQPSPNLTVTVTEEAALEYITWEVVEGGAWISGRFAPGGADLPAPTIRFERTSNPANFVTTTIATAIGGPPIITGIEFQRNYFQTFGAPGLPPPSTLLLNYNKHLAIVSVSGFTNASGYTPAALGGGEFSLTGPSVTSTGKVWHVNPTTIMAEFDTDITFGTDVTIAVTDPGGTATQDTTTTEDKPEVYWVEMLTPHVGMPPFLNEPNPPPDPPYDIKIIGSRFQTGATVVFPNPLFGLLTAPPVVVSPEEITAKIRVQAPAAGLPFPIQVMNPSGEISIPCIAWVCGDYAVTAASTINTFVNSVPSDPAEGQYVTAVIKFGPANPAPIGMIVEVDRAGTYYDIVPGSYKITPNTVEVTVLLPAPTSGAALTYTLVKEFRAAGYISSIASAPILVEPTPAGTVSGVPDLSPGAVGTVTLAGAVGSGTFWPGLTAVGNPTSDITVTSFTPSNNYDDLVIGYEVASTTAPGTPLSIDVTNYSGASGNIPLGNAGTAPVVINTIEYPDDPLVEGRTGVKAVLTGTNIDTVTPAILTVSVGPVSIDSYTVDSTTQITAYLTAPAGSGSTGFTLKVTNPTSNDTISDTILGEAPPAPGLIIKPPTSGAGRIVELPGHNLYMAEGTVPSDCTVTVKRPSGTDAFGGTLAWTSKSNGLWVGAGDLVANVGESLKVEITTPGGHSYTYPNLFTVKAPSVIPTVTSFDPANSEATVTTDFEVNGSNFDSVAVIELECEQPGILPTGTPSLVSVTISGMTTDIIQGEYTLPSYCLGTTWKSIYRDTTLAFLTDKPASTTAVKSTNQPEILAKITGVLPAITKGVSSSNTILVDMNPTTPVTVAQWSASNVVPGSFLAVDTTPGDPGKHFQLSWVNPASSGIKVSIIVNNTLVVPVTGDGFAFTTT